MISARILAISVLAIQFCIPSLNAADFSQYRNFQLNSDLAAVAKQAGKDPSSAKMLYQRPALIQELSWQAKPMDSVKEIVFRFLNRELFSMVVAYDRSSTAGLTAQDMIDGISTTYGAGVDPATDITVLSMYGGEESVKVLARWQDADWSYNLVRFKYETNFALVAVSNRLDADARTAIDEAVRLDKQEAPQKAVDRQNKEDEDKRVEQEKLRVANKPGFRP